MPRLRRHCAAVFGLQASKILLSDVPRARQAAEKASITSMRFMREER